MTVTMGGAVLTVSEHDDVCGVSGGPVPQQVSRGVIHAMRQRLTADHNLTHTDTQTQTHREGTNTTINTNIDTIKMFSTQCPALVIHVRFYMYTCTGHV